MWRILCGELTEESWTEVSYKKLKRTLLCVFVWELIGDFGRIRFGVYGGQVSCEELCAGELTEESWIEAN